MDSKNKIEFCLTDDKSVSEYNEKTFKRLDFDGLIIEVKKSNITKPINVQQGDENKPPIVNGAVVINKPTAPEDLPKQEQLKSTPTEPISSSPTEQTNLENEYLGAAGLWIQTTKHVKNGTEEKPEISPPPVTEEDLAIIRQFMEAPDPDDCLGASNKLMINQEEFVCSICESFILKGEGAVLKCLHSFCRHCLIEDINQNHDEMGQVKCPFPLATCESYIIEEEMEALLDADYGKFLLRIMQMQEALDREKIRNAEASKHDMLPALLETDNHDFIENFETFECAVCITDIEVGAGVILKNCLHKCCKDCIIETVKYSDDFIVKCPYMDDDGSCEFTIQEREVRGLVPGNIFDSLLEKSLKLYEGISSNAYHCKTPDCKGFIEIDENLPLTHFPCQVCAKDNCIKCKAIHEGKNCQEYQDEINPDSKHVRENISSENAIENLIVAGEAMKCPRCDIPVMKKDGCDFLTCTTCRLGICWRTKKPRHPLTKENGTVIDGCNCRELGGVACHPLCQNCH